MVTYRTFQILNEAKLHSNMEFNGLDISIEVPAGGARTGVNKKTGQAWSHKIGAHYGYIKGTHSPDGEHLDCYVRKNPKKDALVYVVHQLTVDGSRFDEDKVMLGFADADEARQMFKSCTFKPTVMFGGMTEFTMEHFRVVAYQASKSTAMLTDEATFAKFQKKGLIPRGILSPLSVARRVSESVTEGQDGLDGMLTFGLNNVGEKLAMGDIEFCLEHVGYQGDLPRSEAELNSLVAEAFLHFVESGMQNDNYLDDDEFRQRALHIITLEDAYMTDTTDDIVAENDGYGYDQMPQIAFEDPRHCDAAYNFANDHMFNVSRDLDKIYFHDANDYDDYMAQAAQSNDSVVLMGDKVADQQAAGYVEPQAAQAPVGAFESYTVMVSTQLLENVGSEYAPLWSHSTGRYIPVQSGLQSYGEARKIVAEVSAGIIPVELAVKESVIGIEIVTDGEFRQFYEQDLSETLHPESVSIENNQFKDIASGKVIGQIVDQGDHLEAHDMDGRVVAQINNYDLHGLRRLFCANYHKVEEDTTEEVFFQQQIQEVKELAGVKNDVMEASSVPSVHDLKARLAALQEELQAHMAESSFQATLDDYPKAMRVLAKTLIKNPKASALACAKAVARDKLGGVEYADELTSFIQSQTGMGLDAYAEEVRETQVVESDSAPEKWEVVSSTQDVTGDDAEAAIEAYAAHDLVDQKPADPGNRFSRDIYTYMNADKNIKVVLTPSYDGGNGGYNVVTVYRLA